MSSGLAEWLALQIRKHFEPARAMPVDVVGLAHEIGVHEIATVRGLIEDGRLEQTGGRVRVLLAGRATAERQRFTLAHELAHLLLADPKRDIIARRIRSDDEVERFCDAFAAALLLPRETVETKYCRRPKTLVTVRHLAAQTETSLAAATVRLNEIADWRCSLLHWRRGDAGWRYRWGAGLPTPYHRTLKSSAGTSSTLDELARLGTGDRHAELEMQAGVSIVRLSGQVSIRGASAIGLLRFAPLV